MIVMMDLYAEITDDGARKDLPIKLRMMDGESLEAFAERAKQVILSLAQEGQST